MRVTDPKLDALIKLFRHENYVNFNERIQERIVHQISINIPVVFGHRDDCNLYSTKCLESIARQNNEQIYSEHNISATVKKDFRYLKRLEFCVGSRVILLSNISVIEGLINGSIGIIKSIKYNSFMKIVESITVSFITTKESMQVELQPTS